MNSATGLMDLIVIAAGAYMLYGYYLLMTKNEVKEGIMISKAASGKKCKDIEGFKKEMGPKVLLFAVTAILNGCIGLISDYTGWIPAQVFWAVYVLFFVVLIWFVMQARKIEKKYYS